MKKNIILFLLFCVLAFSSISAGTYSFTSLTVAKLSFTMEKSHTRTTTSSTALKVTLDKNGSVVDTVKFRALNWYDELPICAWKDVKEGGSTITFPYNYRNGLITKGHANEKIYVNWKSKALNLAAYTIKGKYDYQ